MKIFISILTLFFISYSFAQEQSKESKNTYKKRVLETVEIDFLSSYYDRSTGLSFDIISLGFTYLFK